MSSRRCINQISRHLENKDEFRIMQLDNCYYTTYEIEFLPTHKSVLIEFLCEEAKEKPPSRISSDDVQPRRMYTIHVLSFREFDVTNAVSIIISITKKEN